MPIDSKTGRDASISPAISPEANPRPTRRLFLRHMWRGLAAAPAVLTPLWPARSTALSASNTFALAQLKYTGGQWDPRPRATLALMREIRQRTSVETEDERVVVTLQDPALFSYPFLYMTGEQGFSPLTDSALATLRRYLLFGGLLLIDDARGNKGRDFDASVRRDMARLFPDKPLKVLAPITPSSGLFISSARSAGFA